MFNVFANAPPIVKYCRRQIVFGLECYGIYSDVRAQSILITLKRTGNVNARRVDPSQNIRKCFAITEPCLARRISWNLFLSVCLTAVIVLPRAFRRGKPEDGAFFSPIRKSRGKTKAGQIARHVIGNVHAPHAHGLRSVHIERRVRYAEFYHRQTRRRRRVHCTTDKNNPDGRTRSFVRAVTFGKRFFSCWLKKRFSTDPLRPLNSVHFYRLDKNRRRK